jgi:hypothetical protein
MTTCKAGGFSSSYKSASIGVIGGLNVQGSSAEVLSPSSRASLIIFQKSQIKNHQSSIRPSGVPSIGVLSIFTALAIAL